LIARVSTRAVVGGGYNEFWCSKKRYLVVKGSRASKKSTTAALKLIVRLMAYPLANALVVRKTGASLKDSCWTQLRWAIDRLGVTAFWKARVSPLELEYLPTSQRILFRGMDDPLKVTSITVKRGVLCWGWLEEAYEVSEEAFNRVDESLRGHLPAGYYIQWLLTFNPWDSGSWLKRRFFDTAAENVLAMTTTYQCNEWLSAADLRMFEEMKTSDPERYKVAGLGEWGLAGGQFFKGWRSDLHVVEPFAIPAGWLRFRAMDWGSARPYAVLWFAVDYDNQIYVYRELYGWGGKPNVGTGETAKEVGERICALESRRESVRYGVLDSACWASTGVTGPTVAEELNRVLYDHHLVTFGKCSKGRAAMANQIKQRLLGQRQKDGSFKPALYFFASCLHAIRTIPMLGYDKHNPEDYDTQGEDHACLAAGTKIITEAGNIPIERVQVGDMVLTPKGYRKVTGAARTALGARVYRVSVDNGACLIGTGNHPIFVIGKGFTAITDLKAGDRLLAYRGKERCQEMPRVVSVESAGRADVYNLSVDGVHAYVANGVLVHNCDALGYGLMSRPYTPERPKEAEEARHYRRRRDSAASAWTT